MKVFLNFENFEKIMEEMKKYMAENEGKKIEQIYNRGRTLKQSIFRVLGALGKVERRLSHQHFEHEYTEGPPINAKGCDEKNGSRLEK